MNNQPPTPPEPRPQYIARLGAATVGPYRSIYQLYRNYIDDYRREYDPEADIDGPKESTLRNGVKASSGGFWSTMLHQNRGGKRVLPLPLIIQKLQ